ncbi:MAG TPA: GyrI-like domain-containing protein [Chryseolinea sp.]|nr:GyrI-like domain-containing protein [Chryseolinea sp.]
MTPRIEMLGELKLVGQRMTMSLSANKTRELWQNFMRRRKEIPNTIGTNLYSIQLYDDLYFKTFSPHSTFEKLAAVEVTNFDAVPPEMEAFTMPSGLYAVFLHKGAAATGQASFNYIFSTWFPDSEYSLDNRPHFEVLGEKYKNDDPDSEEEMWIPIK